MKKIICGLVFFSMSLYASLLRGEPSSGTIDAQSVNQSIKVQSVTAQAHEAMPVLIGLMHADHGLDRIASWIKKDLEFTKQFAVTIKRMAHLSSIDDVKKCGKEGYPLCFFVEHDGSHYTWRLYDTSSGTMLKGKKMVQRVHQGSWMRAMAHEFADEWWPELTGSVGFFSTKIAYSKDHQRKGRHCKKFIYVRDATDVEGETEQRLVDTPTISVSPRWNRDVRNPMVLYSEHTKTNVRLMAVGMDGVRRQVSNFDGVNMQASYAPDGGSVVYCLTQAPYAGLAPHTTSQLYYYGFDEQKKKRVFKRITTNDGNNFAPCWGPSDSIFYASDAQGGLPNIAWLDRHAGGVTWLTKGSYATCPAYSLATHMLAYTKMVEGVMQLWTYDLTTKQHVQRTFDATNKDDCSWSPCGTLVVYNVELKGKNRLAIFNTRTQQERFLTSEHEDCSYPCWSPRYDQFPVVNG